MHNLNHTVDTDMYWLVHEDVEDFILEYYPFSYDREFIHNFKVKTSRGVEVRNGIRLVPANADEEKQKDLDEVIGTLKETPIISSSTLKGGLNDLKTYPFVIVDPAAMVVLFPIFTGATKEELLPMKLLSPIIVLCLSLPS